MDRKMYVLAGILGVVALFSAWQFLGALKVAPASRQNADAQTIESVLLSLSSGDKDADGLLDRQESIWGTDFQNPDTDGDGFLDGEEVISGHDPSKSAPNDAIDGFGTENLSRRMESMVISGLAEGSLKPASESFDASADAIALDLTEKLKENLAVPQPKIILTADTAETKRAYLKAVYPVIQSLPDIITPQSENPFIFSITQRKQFAETITTLNAIQTPHAYALFHAQLVHALTSIEHGYALLAEAGTTQDTVTQLGINQALVNVLFDTLPQVVDDFFGLVEQYSS